VFKTGLDGKLFQQFVAAKGKPLKRLLTIPVLLHRAEAAVLIRPGVGYNFLKNILPLLLKRNKNYRQGNLTFDN
jgi:hypothetical protein